MLTSDCFARLNSCKLDAKLMTNIEETYPGTAGSGNSVLIPESDYGNFQDSAASYLDLYEESGYAGWVWFDHIFHLDEPEAYFEELSLPKVAVARLLPASRYHVSLRSIRDTRRYQKRRCNKRLRKVVKSALNGRANKARKFNPMTNWDID